MASAVNFTLYTSYDTTALTIHGAGPAGHTADIDVWYHWDGPSSGVGAAELPPGVVGRASCQSIAVSGTGGPLVHNCNHWHVIYDDESAPGHTTNYYRGLACHETGHTVGLKHPDWRVAPPSEPGYSSASTYRCMGVGSEPLLGPHNVAHINSYY